MFIDLCLKFSGEEEAKVVLVEAGISDLDQETGELITKAGFAVDIIGQLMAPTGEMMTFQDADGQPYDLPKMEFLEGWHVNVRCTDIVPAAVQQYKVEPKSPKRVWA